MTTIQEQIKDLETQIVSAASRYYGEGSDSPLSDDEFDALIDRLKKLKPDHWVLTQVGWGYGAPSGRKRRHIGGLVGSLKKIKYPDTDPRFFRGGYITPKLDGLTVVLYFWVYNDVVVFYAITRGDGYVGVDVTGHMQRVISAEVLNNIKSLKRGMFSVRGEVVIPNEFESIFKDKRPESEKDKPISLRNVAAGILNRIDVTDDVEYLRFLPYWIRLDSKKYLNQVEMFGEFVALGITPPSILVPVPDSILVPDTLQDIFKEWSKTYPLDGLVLRPRENWSREDSICYSEVESDALAYKFDNESVVGVVRGVEWNVGSMGRIAPRVVLEEPVDVSGASIRYITGNNYLFIKNFEIGPGAIVKIIRANEVIPKIVEVLTPAKDIIIPVRCPDCQSLLKNTGVDLMCENRLCLNQAIGTMTRLLEVCGIPDGLGETVIFNYIQYRKAETVEQFLDGFGLSSDLVTEFKPHYAGLLSQLENNITERLKAGVDYKTFWYLLNLQGVAESNAEKMSEIDPRSPSLVDDVVQAGLPINVTASVGINREFISDMAKRFRFVQGPEKKTKVLSVVITGKLSKPRDELAKELSDLGVDVCDSVTKKINYLVCDAPSSSSKYVKAVKLGIPIITEMELLKCLSSK